MPDEKPTSVPVRIVLVVGSALIIIGIVWSLLLVTAGNETVVAAAQRQTGLPISDEATPGQAISQTLSQTGGAGEPGGITSLSAPLLYDTDLGTMSIEFSAVTLNESTNRVVIADDEGQLFEFDLTPEGAPVVPARRTITIDVGDNDIEGLAWMSRTTYVLAHESDGVLSIVDIPDDVRVIDEQHRLRTIETGLVENDGRGIEGVTVSRSPDAAFVVVVEQPPSLHFVDGEGITGRVVPLRLGLADVSGVWAAVDGTFWVVSHENAVVVRLDIAEDGTINQRQQVDLVFPTGRFPQAEGITMSRDGSRLYVVGEGAARSAFTFAFWSVDPG